MTKPSKTFRSRTFASAALCVACACGVAAQAQRRAPSASSPSSPSAQGGRTDERAANRPGARGNQQNGRADELIAAGAAALENGDASAARTRFEQALKADPANVAAHTYLGVLADRAGQYEEAERHFSAAAIAAPFSPSARNNYGAILMRLGRMELAARQFELSLKLDPQQPSALVNLAQIRSAHDTADDLREARALFERARAIAPDADIMRSLLLIAARQHDRAALADYYREYRAQVQAGQVQAGEGATGDAAARLAVGAALLEAGLGAESVEELSAASAVAPSNTDAVILLSRAYLLQKDVRSAGRTLEAAVARGVDAGPVYAALADLYELSGHVENAIPAMRLAIARDPSNEAYRFRYGMLLTDTRAPAAAVIRLQEALKEFPRSARLWFALGVAHYSEHKNFEAAQAFTRALELEPKFAPALAYQGMLEAEQGNYARAIELYEQSLANDEKIAVAHYLAADAMLKLQNPDLARAESHLRRAIALDESFAPAHLALGKIHVRSEKFADAAAQFERVLTLDPKLIEAHYQLGRTYLRLKRTQEGQAELELYKRLNESDKEQKENERRELVRRLANVRF